MKQVSIYQVEDKPLGSGGMGQVLKGYDPNGTPVAIKEILPEFVSDMEFRYRIDQEIKCLQQFNNDSIVKIYNHFELNGNLYIVMELVEGQTIEQYIEQHGALPMMEAVQLMIRILQAMQCVHEQGIVHRDVKPGNIMIRPNKDVCILDFGVAKNVNSANGGHTMVGTVIGTDGYMSPEQADGMSIDHRSDIYSLACVFFYMLTAHHAYQKLDNDIETATSIIEKPFPKLKKYLRGVPANIQTVMDHATEKNMMKRYQSCREFCSDLMRAAGIGTQINTGNRGNTISISIGRENCDISVSLDNYKVSRHHADVVLKEFTGGTFYVYTDKSSNGTLINGQKYTNGMSCNIKKGDTPVIYLACDTNCPLNWEDVRSAIAEKLKEAGVSGETDDSSGKTSAMSEEELKEQLEGMSEYAGYDEKDPDDVKNGWKTLALGLVCIILGFFIAAIPCWGAAIGGGIFITIRSQFTNTQRILGAVLATIAVVIMALYFIGTSIPD